MMGFTERVDFLMLLLKFFPYTDRTGSMHFPSDRKNIKFAYKPNKESSINFHNAVIGIIIDDGDRNIKAELLAESDFIYPNSLEVELSNGHSECLDGAIVCIYEKESDRYFISEEQEERVDRYQTASIYCSEWICNKNRVWVNVYDDISWTLLRGYDASGEAERFMLDEAYAENDAWDQEQEKWDYDYMTAQFKWEDAQRIAKKFYGDSAGPREVEAVLQMEAEDEAQRNGNEAEIYAWAGQMRNS